MNNTAGHKTLVVQAYAHTKVGTVTRHWVMDIIDTPSKSGVHFITMLFPVSGEAEAQVL